MDISGATSKDYLPSPLEYIVSSSSRGGETLVVQYTYNYRRIAIIEYRIANNTTGIFSPVETSKSYSNEININSGRVYGPETLIVYPNPASSTVYIENKGTDFILSETKVNIVNMTGTIVNSNNFSIINPNLISIDVSNFLIGHTLLTLKLALDQEVINK